MIFDFKDYNEWMHHFKKIFEEYQYVDAIDKLKNIDGALEIKDITDILGTKIINDIENHIIKNYTHIVFYHGTATDDIYSYLKDGLLPLDLEKRNNYARAIFNQEEYPDITDKVFLAVTNELSEDEDSIKLRINRIYFTLDDKLLKESSSSHYLIYGGEYLLFVAQKLGHFYPRELEKKLTPVIFKCKIPIDLINDDLFDISKEIIVRYFENMVYPDYKFPTAEFTPYVTSKLEANCIIGCEFPKDIECDLRKYH